MQSHMSYSSCSFCLLDRTTQISVFLGLEQLKFGSLSTILSYWPQRMTEAIRSSVTAWNWVTVRLARVIQVIKDGFHSETGLARVDQRCLMSCAVRQVQKLASKNRDAWVCQHCFRGCRSGRSACRAQTIRQDTATSRFAWPSVPEGSLFWGLAHKKKDLQTVCWRQPGQEHELLEPCPWSDESKVNVFDSDGVQHVWSRPGEEYQENCALP